MLPACRPNYAGICPHHRRGRVVCSNRYSVTIPLDSTCSHKPLPGADPSFVEPTAFTVVWVRFKKKKRIQNYG